MTTGSFHTPNTQRKGRRWSDSQMDGLFLFFFFFLPTTDFLFLMFLDSQRNQKCGSLAGYLNGKDPFNSQAGDKIHCVAFISLNFLSSSESSSLLSQAERESGGALGGANVPKAGLKLNHCLQRNRLDARIMILRPIATLGIRLQWKYSTSYKIT